MWNVTYNKNVCQRFTHQNAGLRGWPQLFFLIQYYIILCNVIFIKWLVTVSDNSSGGKYCSQSLVARRPTLFYMQVINGDIEVYLTFIFFYSVKYFFTAFLVLTKKKALFVHVTMYKAKAKKRLRPSLQHYVVSASGLNSSSSLGLRSFSTRTLDDSNDIGGGNEQQQQQLIPRLPAEQQLLDVGAFPALQSPAIAFLFTRTSFTVEIPT